MRKHANKQRANSERGPVRVLLSKIVGGLWRLFKRHKLAFILTVLILSGLLFWQRHILQPHVLNLRKYSFLAVFLAPVWLFLVWFIHKRSVMFKCVVLAIFFLINFFGWKYEVEAYRYAKLYFRYKTLSKVELQQLPLTDHERVQPLNSVYTQALENITDVENPTEFDFVRCGNEYRFTAAIEPARDIRRMFNTVEQIFSIPGTSAAANFSNDNRVAVRFNEGETMRFSRNIRQAVRQAFGPLQYLSYEPDQVIRIQDDSGKWVQVVSLIRWTGVIFPRPEFGGVMVLRQRSNNPLESFRRSWLGSGRYVSPKSISRYPYLAGQNLTSYLVSRFVAESFRFQNGFWGPMPGVHKGDIRIPDLPGDQNDQPFVSYYRMSAAADDADDKLYDYFALEPFDTDKQGLNTSVWYPSDGQGPVYFYRHFARGGVLSGVSTIPAKVMESRKNYDWSRHRPVEQQPFIRDIEGKRRFFWRSTVVTMKDDVPGKADSVTVGVSIEHRFIAGTVPEVVLTDAEYKVPVWVDALHHDRWTTQLRDALTSVWLEDQ